MTCKTIFQLIALITIGTSSISGRSLVKNKDIVIIDVARHDRDQIAQLVKLVDQSHPKIIGLDVFFFSDSLKKDHRLTKSIRHCNNIVLASKLLGHVRDNFYTKHQKSIYKFTHGKELGFSNFVAYNQVVKEFQPRAFAEFQMHYSFGIQVCKKYNSVQTQRFLNRNLQEEKINYIGNIDHFQHYTFSKLKLGSLKEQLKNKIVLLGNTSIDEASDLHLTPLSDSRSMKPSMHGVVVQANIIATILDQKME